MIFMGHTTPHGLSAEFDVTCFQFLDLMIIDFYLYLVTLIYSCLFFWKINGVGRSVL